MKPTLLIKDRILVNKFAYGPKIPFLKKRFLWQGKPKRWDVIVFTTHGIDKTGDFAKNFVKRVAALPGEEVEIKDGEIYINGQHAIRPQWMQEHNSKMSKLISSSDNLENLNPDDIILYHYGYAPPGKPAGYIKVDYYIDLFGLHLFEKKYTQKFIQKGYYEYGFKDQKFTVPPDCYFVLGDNSKYSYDSRGWGFVPYKNIKGKVIYIWWPLGRIRGAK